MAGGTMPIALSRGTPTLILTQSVELLPGSDTEAATQNVSAADHHSLGCALQHDFRLARPPAVACRTHDMSKTRSFAFVCS
eukprot:2391451-Rhodomonas_salina.2